MRGDGLTARNQYPQNQDEPQRQAVSLPVILAKIGAWWSCLASTVQVLLQEPNSSSQLEKPREINAHVENPLL